MHNKIPAIFTFISDFKKEEILKFDKNIGIILRNYNKTIQKDKLIKLRNFCKKNKKKIFLANNLKLAKNLNFDGVYLPSFNRSLNTKNQNLKKKFLMLGSAHNVMEIKLKEKQGIKVIFISPLFKTNKNKKYLGIVKFNLLAGFCNKKIIALGGINKSNINQLKNTNVYGYSGISYFRN